MITKIATIARREYGAMVATKAFLLSIAVMPLLMFGGIFLATWLKDVQDVNDKTIVVVDGTGGEMFGDLQGAVANRNQSLPTNDEGTPTAPKYILERYASDKIDGGERLALSDRLRRDEIRAFVEIPAELLVADMADGGDPLKFYAQSPMLADERRWVERAVNEAVTARRLASMNIDAGAVRQATRHVPVTPLGPVRPGEDEKPTEDNDLAKAATVLLPFGFLMLMFMVIMLTAQPMLESVLEEKSQRIAEVLLGSANPFQLMGGKLLGSVAGSLSIVAIYALGGYAIAAHYDWTDRLPLDLAPWFLLYQVLAVLLFGSIFMAVGAAVSQLKEAQSLLMPVWLLMASPMFVWLQIVREPNGSIATGLSFFPPAIPMVMVLRLASEAVVPLWQILAGLLLLVATTVLCVFLAGRIFRVGILWQGKTPRVAELFRWALRG